MQVFLAKARGAVRNGDLLRAAYARAVQQVAIRNGIEVSPAMTDPLIETLTVVADNLDLLEIPYAITGSVASSAHGEPIQSMDADLVLAALPSRAAAFSKSLSQRFYAPEDVLVDASKTGGFTNVIDGQTGMKIDLSFVGNDAFLQQCLGRRVRERIGSHPREFWFVTPEDIILMKLLWRKDSKSNKQWENALGVARYKGARMDWKYLFEQARSLGIEEDLIKLRDEAGI
jgi:hypothetical protein